MEVGDHSPPKDAETWLREMRDYAYIRLNFRPQQISRMTDVAITVKPWEKSWFPIDWVNEYHRGRHPEDM